MERPFAGNPHTLTPAPRYCRAWLHVIGPDNSIDTAVSRDVLNRALASLDRPTVDS